MLISLNSQFLSVFVFSFYHNVANILIISIRCCQNFVWVLVSIFSLSSTCTMRTTCITVYIGRIQTQNLLFLSCTLSLGYNTLPRML